MDECIRQIVACSGDPSRGLDELARFEAAYSQESGRPFPWDEKGSRNLARLFGNSRALAERIVAHPCWADTVALSAYADSRKPAKVMIDELAREIDAAAPAGDEDAFMRALRYFKYKEMARIAMRDLTGDTPVRELLAEWSDAADALLDAAYARAYATLAARHGKPLIRTPEGAAMECSGCILALGKLGGRELNMSSDVDLIVLYRSDEGVPPSEGGVHLTNHEFFVKLAALLTRYISHATDAGFVFRVDHELRPEGPQGALANSLDAAERYYQYFGRDWERQALIRARTVAGDSSLGGEFIEAVRPFVYRRHIAVADISHMKELKTKMEQSAARRQQSYDVKVGAGGIREVEFLVQAICLMFGGKRPALRIGNTFEAIDLLAREGLMHPYGAKRLSDAYAFLRRMENMLQVADEVQTHRLPQDSEGLLALARRLGYHESDALHETGQMQAELDRTRRSVEGLFRAIFEADYERSELMEAIRDNASRASGEEEEIESLAWFKNQEVRRIQQLDIEGTMQLPHVLMRLSLAAEAVLTCAWEMAEKHLHGRFGTPLLSDGTPAGFAMVGVGSLGASEVDYGSDLDLCFIFAGDGETDGAKRITNFEYFTKVAQRIITTITLPGRYGRAYQIDSELRPSGNAGTLVATIDSFRAYHATAALWERRSVLKARAITGDAPLVDEVRAAIEAVAYDAPLPPEDDIRAEIAHIRRRTIDERARTRPNVINVKIGAGGLADLEAIVQFHQLLYGRDSIALRRQNTFAVLDALRAEGLMESELLDAVEDNFFFFRRLLSRTRLALGRATDEVNFTAPFVEALAAQMGCQSSHELKDEIERRMMEVARLFHENIEARIQKSAFRS